MQVTTRTPLITTRCWVSPPPHRRHNNLNSASGEDLKGRKTQPESDERRDAMGEPCISQPAVSYLRAEPRRARTDKRRRDPGIHQDGDRTHVDVTNGHELWVHPQELMAT